MTRFFRFLIRATTFLRKEMAEMIRQPRLVILFVLGPFLIMLLFGLGFRNPSRPLHAIFVASPENQLSEHVEEFAKGLGPQLVYEGLVTNEAEAMADLKQGKVDMVVVLPEEVVQKLENKEQAIFKQYHNEIDPFQASYVEYIGNFYIDELNEHILKELVSGSQQGITGEVQQLDGAEANLGSVLTTFNEIPPELMVSPFGIESHRTTSLELTPTGFFSPGVIILLLQHLALTFAALSIVRENVSGAMELFRVAPISAFEILIGKYLSYLIFAGILAVVISLLVVYVLGVPMLGNWGDYAIVLAALIFAALGAGFLISLISETDTQAVQYSMLLLLASIFFSGFFLDLRSMWEPLRILSAILPATYGIGLLQNIMLRGGTLEPIMIGGLLFIGVFTFLLSWVLLNRTMKKA